jgi:hypothetical protein
MIKKLGFAIAGILFLFVLYRYNFQDKEPSPDDHLPVKVLSYRTNSGWGYEIEVDGKVFIHQDNIPAVQGNRSFESAADALKVGEFVLAKMKNNKKPVITVEELKGMKIKDI